ncbi:MAG TPA: GAF domain-containing protein [Candidatus Limnocylindrales bacterium]|nr:GAF domain-containing protein [Candidatus Limnocylindrales bacterium]
MTASPTPRAASEGLLTEQAVSTTAFVRALDQLGHGVLVLEGEKILDASEAMCRLLGLDRAALLNLPSALELVTPHQQEPLRHALERHARGERPGDHYTVGVVAANGATVSLQMAVKSIPAGEGIPRLLVVAQDIGRHQGVLDQLSFQSRMLQAIAEAAIDGILVVNADGRMVYFNRQFVEMWRIPPAVVASRSDEAALAAVSRQLADPEAFRRRVEHLYKHPHEEGSDEIVLLDGRVFDRYSAPVLDLEGQPRGRVWFFRDVTDRRRAEAARELLARSGELLGASLDVDTTLGQVAEAVVPHFADWAAVDVLDERGIFRRVGVAHVEPGGDEILRELDRRWPLRPGEGHLRGHVVATREPVALYQVSSPELRRLARDRDHRRLLNELGMASALWVPLVARERALGVISVGMRAGRAPFNEKDLELISELARRAALAIDNAMLYRALDRGGQRQAALAAVGRSALAGASLAELLQLAAERLAEAIPAPFTEVLELMPGGRQLRLLAGVGWRKGRIGRARVSGGRGSQAGFTMSEAKPVVTEDLSLETRFRPSGLVTGHGVASGLNVIIGSPARPWGVLGAHSDVPRRYSADEVAFVQAMADTLASAIERQRSEQELARVAHLEQARAAELKAVIEGMGDAVVVCDPAGVVVLANPAARALLGRRLDGGMRLILASFAWAESGRAPAIEALTAGTELRLVRGPAVRRGQQPWMELSVYRVAVGEADTPADGGTILVMRDITSVREARAMRDAFLGILSHELRTPVTTIYGGAEILARQALSRHVRDEVYDDIRHEADRLYRLVENLLVLSRVERGGLQIDVEPVLLQRVLPRIVEAEARRWPATTFSLDLAAGLPPVGGEETYLEQVLQNLLGNAGKYGGSQVVIRATELLTEVSVVVLDDGAGFDSDETDRLFDVFYRSPAAARRASGAGIGLFVSSQLVRAMNGRIWARNRDEGGAEFGFSVPVFED